MRGRAGMTLVELMVSLAIVLLIIASATVAYMKLLTTYKSQGALSESYIANLTSLDLIRYDIQMGGFGLFTSFSAVGGAPTNYNEAAAGSVPTPYYDPTKLNDATTGVPRPFVFGASLTVPVAGPNNSAVLAIKSTTAWINPTSAKWSTITNLTRTLPTVTATSNNFVSGEHVTVIDDTGALQLFGASFNINYYGNASALGNNAYPSDPGRIFYIYGTDDNATADRMPFNRVDYYLDNSPDNANVPGVPTYCAPGTYVLYRATISQIDGTLQRSALIDCVEDFQVAFGVVSPNTSNAVKWQKDLCGENIPGGAAGVHMTAAQEQQYLRDIRFFVLYQEGRGKVSNTSDFNSSSKTFNLGDQDIANSLDSGTYLAGGNNFQQVSTGALADAATVDLNGAGTGFTPNAQQAQYRWKIMEIDAKPMNMLNLTTIR
ncbi:MAG: prepilin-type N-terminal cleavage/methylation domain-containing protein [Syntrophobacteraceae bacterium]